MEAVIFSTFFFFSFLIFVLGVWQKSFIFSISGSLLMIILSIILIGFGVQTQEEKNIVLTINGEEETYKAKVSGGTSDVMTYSLGLLLGIFSSFFFIYSIWQFVMERRMRK